MIEIILKAILLGLVISLSTGPVFFMLIDTTLSKGIRQGFFFSLGALFSDIMIVALLLTGSLTFLMPELKNPSVKFAGGVLFILFGIIYFFSIKFKSKPKNHSRIDFFKGFLVNTLNPTVTIFWFTIITLVVSDFPPRNFYHILFFAIAFGILFMMNIVKILAARKLRKYTTDKHLLILNRITSIILLLFGSFLVIQYIHSIYLAG